MRTAGFLYGHLRTWNLIKERAIDSYTEIFGDIDWYVAVWDSSTDTKESMKSFFKKKNLNLIFLEFFDENSLPTVNMEKINFNDSFSARVFSNIYKSYLIYILSREKRVYEYKNNFEYSKTILTRPDVLLYYNSSSLNQFQENKNFCLQVQGDYINNFSYFPITTTHDVFLILGSYTSDLFGTMYIDNNTYCDNSISLHTKAGCSHSYLNDFLVNHYITTDRLNNSFIVYPQVIRPTMDLEKIFSEYKNWDSRDQFTAGADDVWSLRDRSLILPYLDKHSIDYNDYTKW